MTDNKHLKAIFEGQELTEEFQDKLTAIFESAIKEKEDEIKAKADAEKEEEIEKVKKKAEEVTETYKTEILLPNINKYLEAAISEWVEENKSIEEANLTVEMAHDFLTSMTGLVESKGLKIEKKDLDINESLRKEIADMKEDQRKLVESNIEMKKQNQDLVKEKKSQEAIAKFNLTESQVEKIKESVSNLTYRNDEQFETAVKSIVESYFPKENIEKQIKEEKEKEVIKEEIEDPYFKNLMKNL